MAQDGLNQLTSFTLTLHADPQREMPRPPNAEMHIDDVPAVAALRHGVGQLICIIKRMREEGTELVISSVMSTLMVAVNMVDIKTCSRHSVSNCGGRSHPRFRCHTLLSPDTCLSGDAFKQ